MSRTNPRTFEDFWPNYVAHHSQFGTRLLHLAGFFSVIGLLLTAALLREPYFVAAAPFAAYGCCWIGHFFIENDVPASFTNPVWSVLGFFKMVRLTLTGKMDDEVERCLYVRPPGRPTSLTDSQQSTH